MSPTPPNPSDVTLAVLAGGEGSRMGLPKAHLRIHDQPILHYLLDRFRWPGPTLLVTAPGREHPPGHDRFTREVTDPVPNQGPLRGLLTALDASPTDLLLVTTVDMPGISPVHLLDLLSLHHAPLVGLMLQRVTDDGTQFEPFPSLFHRSLRPTVASLLESDSRSLRHLRSHPSVAVLDAPSHWPPDAFTNLNRPEDLHAFLSQSTSDKS